MYVYVYEGQTRLGAASPISLAGDKSRALSKMVRIRQSLSLSLFRSHASRQSTIGFQVSQQTNPTHYGRSRPFVPASHLFIRIHITPISIRIGCMCVCVCANTKQQTNTQPNQRKPNVNMLAAFGHGAATLLLMCVPFARVHIPRPPCTRS